MFFDDIDTTDSYENYLILIAKKQKELFDNCFDWNKKQGYLMSESRRSKEMQLLKELHFLKEDLKKYRESEGYSTGIFWWNLSWEEIKKYLLYDLENLPENGKWRFEYQWLHTGGNEGWYKMLLHETGHYSDFSSERIYDYQEDSNYSSGERVEMVRDFNRSLNRLAMIDMLDDRHLVKSLDTGMIYASKFDYYNSSEYISDRIFYSKIYERSLYTVHETVGVHAVSNSRHYECIFDVADYHIKNGILDYIELHKFSYCDGQGDLPTNIKGKYCEKDSLVVCAGYLATNSQVRSVPLQLFGKEIKEASVSFDEAMRQAEIYTCLAEKITEM